VLCVWREHVTMIATRQTSERVRWCRRHQERRVERVFREGKRTKEDAGECTCIQDTTSCWGILHGVERIRR